MKFNEIMYRCGECNVLCCIDCYVCENKEIESNQPDSKDKGILHTVFF